MRKVGTAGSAASAGERESRPGVGPGNEGGKLRVESCSTQDQPPGGAGISAGPWSTGKIRLIRFIRAGGI